MSPISRALKAELTDDTTTKSQLRAEELENFYLDIMSKSVLRLTVLHGVLMMFVGVFFAGLGLTWLVVRDVYGHTPPFEMSGDYRAWLMAHLQGLFNGLIVIALGFSTQLTEPISHTREKILASAMLIMGWGNTSASTLAAVFNVRGMAPNESLQINIVMVIFTIAFAATIYVFYVVIRHLWAAKPA